MLLEFLFHAKPENHPKNFSVISNQKLYTFYVFDAEFLTPEKTSCSHIFGQIAASFCRKRYDRFLGLDSGFHFSLLTSNLCA